MSTATERDLEPLRLVLSSLLRRWWIIGIVSVLAAAGAYVVLGKLRDDTGSTTATARIGLTPVVQWPFYDAEIDKAQTYVSTPEFATELAAKGGHPVLKVETVVPDALAVLDVKVTSDTGQHAIDLANVAAQMLVDHSTATEQADKDAEIATFDQEIADLDARIAELEPQVAELSAKVAELSAQRADDPNNADLIDQSFLAESDRNTAAGTLDELKRRREGAVSERAGKQAEQINVQPGNEVVRSATLGTDGSSRKALTLAVLLGTLTAASIAVIVVDRRVGKVRSPWQLVHVCGATSVDELEVAGRGTLKGVAGLADGISAAARDGAHVIGVLDATQAGLDARALAEHLERQGLLVAVSTQAEHDARADVTLVDVSAEFHDDTPRVLGRRCDRIVVLVDESTTLAEADRLIDQADVAAGVLTTAFVRSH